MYTQRKCTSKTRTHQPIIRSKFVSENTGTKRVFKTKPQVIIWPFLTKQFFTPILAILILTLSGLVLPQTIYADAKKVFTAGELQSAFGTDEEIVLAADITTTNGLTVNKDSILDLSGYKLKVEVDSGNGIKIASGKTLTIMDSQYSSQEPGSGKLTVINKITNGSLNQAAGSGAAINTTDATLIIKSGVVETKGGYGGAGIGGSAGRDGGYGSNGSSGGSGGNVIINGGSVTSIGGDGGAGIGGGMGGKYGSYTSNYAGSGGNGGTVTITAGTVTATGGYGGTYIGGAGAGIGGGAGGAADNFNRHGGGGIGGNVTITGGLVTANGGINGGVGIGVGCTGSGAVGSGASGSITLNGSGTVLASSVSDTDISRRTRGVLFEGNYGRLYGNIELGYDLTIPVGRLLVIPSGSGAIFTVPSGITLTNNGIIANHGTIANNGIIINEAGTIKNIGVFKGNNPTGASVTTVTTVSTEAQLRTAFYIGGKALLTNSVNITAATAGAGLFANENTILDLNGYKLSVTVASGNGIQIASGKTLTIMDSLYTSKSPGSGKLTVTNNITASSAAGGAGINTTDAKLIIESGVIEVKAGYGGAGIGGGGGGQGSYGNSGGAGGTVIINGGEVTAVGGQGGAGIGGGIGGSSDGGGYGGAGGIVTINGGTVTATAGASTGLYGTVGAGIGGGGGGLGYLGDNYRGIGGDGSTVTVTGGKVTANSGSADGIGGGDGKWTSSGGTFTLNGNGMVFASSVRDSSISRRTGGILFVQMSGMWAGDYEGTLYGNVQLGHDLTITSRAATLVIPSGTTLTVPEGITLTNYGSITNNAKIINNGTIINNNIIGNYNTIDNFGTISGNKILNYYTVSYSVVDGANVNGSTISATYGGSSISSGDTVLEGKELIVTATGMGAEAYSYKWSGTASGTEATYTTTVNGVVNAICTVTGVINAKTPIINTQPIGAEYIINTIEPFEISVTASSADNGVLSYQWYKNSTNSTGGAAIIGGATNKTYTPSIDTVGTMYYYVVITNTNNSVNGTKTAKVISDMAIVSVASSGILYEGNNSIICGDVELESDLQIDAGKTLIIRKDATLTIPKGKILTNNGMIVNEGVVINNGNLINGGSIMGDGTIGGDNPIIVKNPEITIVKVGDNEVTVKLPQSLENDNVLIIAFCKNNEDGNYKILDTTLEKAAEIDGAERSVSIPIDTEIIRVMLWDNIFSMRPLCPAVTKIWDGDKWIDLN